VATSPGAAFCRNLRPPRWLRRRSRFTIADERDDLIALARTFRRDCPGPDRHCTPTHGPRRQILDRHPPPATISTSPTWPDCSKAGPWTLKIRPKGEEFLVRPGKTPPGQVHSATPITKGPDLLYGVFSSSPPVRYGRVVHPSFFWRLRPSHHGGDLPQGGPALAEARFDHQDEFR